MGKSNILIGCIVMLFIAFAVFEFNQLYTCSELSKALIVPVFTLLYFISVPRKSPFFTWFLVLFSISELLAFSELCFDFDSMTDAELLRFDDTYYLVGNTLYIIAYALLVYDVSRTLDFKKIFKNFGIHLLVLTILNIYIVYVLLTIVNPYVSGSFLFVIELVYNIVMLILLTLSLVGYFYNDNKKSLLLFFGSICIVFSEVIQVAYFYISDKDLLNISQTLLFVLAFCFFYFQSKIQNKKVQFFG
ncbi:hypothetical protein [Hanstruepera marina]|uniref:hypothetical protein n=1 Tax=Hanstruepera marina TaxID=2873265 RepID=UPI001CA6ECB5|nr:hypothetical protein [Hanstruepera marina]